MDNKYDHAQCNTYSMNDCCQNNFTWLHCENIFQFGKEICIPLHNTDSLMFVILEFGSETEMTMNTSFSFRLPQGKLGLYFNIVLSYIPILTHTQHRSRIHLPFELNRIYHSPYNSRSRLGRLSCES